MKWHHRVFPTGVGLATLVGLSTMAARAIAQELNCNNPQTQAEMNYCSALDYQTADQRLNQVYQQLRPELPAASREDLVNAQRAWIKLRDADCELARSQFEGGSIAPLIHNTCLSGATNKRTRELEIYYNGLVPQAGGSDYQAADRWLNETYQQVRSFLQGETGDRLTEAELAWIEFRDKSCQFEAAYVSGSKDTCLIRMTEERTLELSNLMEMTP